MKDLVRPCILLDEAQLMKFCFQSAVSTVLLGSEELKLLTGFRIKCTRNKYALG